MILLALLLACGPKAPPLGPDALEGPESALIAFNHAITTEDPALAERASTPGFWTREGDGGQGLYAQAVGKGFTLATYERLSSPDYARSVITADVVHGGEVADRVHLYVLLTPEGWRIDGINENDAMVPLYLQGYVEPGLSVEDLPPSPALEALGADLLAGRAVLTGTDGPYIQAEVAARTDPRIVSAHWHEPTWRGALRIASGDTEEIWAYFHHTSAGWYALGWSYAAPSTESFLRDPR